MSVVGVKQTLLFDRAAGAYDPKRTSTGMKGSLTVHATFQFAVLVVIHLVERRFVNWAARLVLSLP
jgi:hypothetical protein